jgi:hypothetical protein
MTAGTFTKSLPAHSLASANKMLMTCTHVGCLQGADGRISVSNQSLSDSNTYKPPNIKKTIFLPIRFAPRW